jgi:GINS complex subunit 1
MYGDISLKLALLSKRTLSLPSLPPYATELVRLSISEILQLHRQITAILAPYNSTPFAPSDDPAAAVTLLVDHLCMRRNKRCLLAYHRVRTERLEGLCWEGREDDVLSGEQRVNDSNAAASDEAGSSALSPEEEEYTRQYSDLLSSLKGHWTDIDLAGSLEPPRELFVDVRVVRDAGEIQTEYGAIRLAKNSQFWVRETDVGRLIEKGWLVKLG